MPAVVMPAATVRGRRAVGGRRRPRNDRWFGIPASLDIPPYYHRPRPHAARAVSERTLVFFSSDNGPVWYPSDIERLRHAAVGPPRSVKGDAWEGGHRVPFPVRWPGASRSPTSARAASRSRAGKRRRPAVRPASSTTSSAISARPRTCGRSARTSSRG